MIQIKSEVVVKYQTKLKDNHQSHRVLGKFKLVALTQGKSRSAQ
jgi:hypothetical protein